MSAEKELQNELINLFRDFLDWRDELPHEKRGGVKMFDVKGYYKWLTEIELFNYYMDNIRNKKY